MTMFLNSSLLRVSRDVTKQGILYATDGQLAGGYCSGNRRPGIRFRTWHRSAAHVKSQSLRDAAFSPRNSAERQALFSG